MGRKGETYKKIEKEWKKDSPNRGKGIYTQRVEGGKLRPEDFLKGCKASEETDTNARG